MRPHPRVQLCTRERSLPYNQGSKREEDSVDLRRAPVASALRPDLPSPAILRGGWAGVARALWILLALSALALFVASLLAYYQQALTLTAPAIRDPDHRGMGNPEAMRAALRDLGLSVRFYAAYTTAIFALFGAVYASVGLAIFSRKPNERVALAVSLWLVTFGATFTPASLSLDGMSPVLDLFRLAVGNVALLAFFLLFFLFPDGRFVPGWTRWVALYLAAGVTLDHRSQVKPLAALSSSNSRPVAA